MKGVTKSYPLQLDYIQLALVYYILSLDYEVCTEGYMQDVIENLSKATGKDANCALEQLIESGCISQVALFYENPLSEPTELVGYAVTLSGAKAFCFNLKANTLAIAYTKYKKSDSLKVVW
jgi:hypothetical protein